jgi:hypothetical protein
VRRFNGAKYKESIIAGNITANGFETTSLMIPE